MEDLNLRLFVYKTNALPAELMVYICTRTRIWTWGLSCIRRTLYQLSYSSLWRPVLVMLQCEWVCNPLHICSANRSFEEAVRFELTRAFAPLGFKASSIGLSDTLPWRALSYSSSYSTGSMHGGSGWIWTNETRRSQISNLLQLTSMRRFHGGREEFWNPNRLFGKQMLLPLSYSPI